ncbi:hypothetical protein P280DRAFT_550675 [Massarina eburnea CBS 473.64]|uniref:CAP-Gly domain-containing protein n=1 Tax=Massarina eburnea CBS 473.64 TaxID=1395130 RepID=A0A6A6RV70_9PLEO|nr:hypothetical protein P280DRAFT_550675 [Massarina eburnea CBS 473.64]
MLDFEIGDVVKTANNRTGTVKYIGAVEGKTETWVGLELDGPEGKNNGTVQGVEYFECKPLHGIFTKLSDITQLISAVAAPKTPSKPPTRPGTRPVPGARPAATSRARPGSIGAPKSPTKPPARTPSGGVSKPALQARQSFSQARSPAVGGRPPSRPPSQTSRPTSVVAAKQPPPPSAPVKRASIGSTTLGGVRTARKPSGSVSSTVSTTRPGPSASVSSAATARTPKDPAAQALETRLRQLEKQNGEQNVTIQELMPFKAKAEKNEALAKKISEKFKDAHTELQEAKRAASIATAELEKAQEEFEISLENTILDKETAEAERDEFQDQTEMLRATIEELELDKQIYEEQAEASMVLDEDMSEEEAQGIHLRRLQMENKKLRAAIIDFRDIHHEREAETKRLRLELEQTIEASESRAKECVELNAKIVQHEDTITTLREQVDANHEWEEILEDVTQRANNLEERNMRQTLEIKELEMVNEVSTETISEYVEFTNDLQAESSQRETELAEMTRDLEQERISNSQKDATLAKYSDAFAEFQNQLQDQDMQQLMSEEKAQGMTDKFNKMMDLHRTMQADRAKDTAKTIDNELTKLSEKEAREELQVLKYYLPENSGEYIHSSLRIYFRAKKIAFKANMIASILTTMDPLTNEGPEKVLTNVYRYDTMYHLEYIRSHGEHFVSAITHCTLEQYRNTVSEYEDISVVETTIERTLDSLKRDDVNMKDLSGSIRGTNKIMRNMTSISQRISNARPDNELVLHTSLLRSSLERIRASFDAVKQYTQLVAEFEPESEDRLDALVERLRKPQTAALECIALVTKMSQALATLQGDDLYPQFPSGVQEVADLSESISAYADKAYEFVGQIITFDPNNQDDETPSVEIDELTMTVNTALKLFAPKDVEDLFRDVKSTVAHWNEYASVLNNTAEIERLPAPWIVRAQEIEASKKHAIDSEKKLQHLTTEHQATLIQIREREEIIDTKELEIEHLRAKHKEAVSKAENMEKLQQELQEAKTDLASYKREIEQQKEDMEELRNRAENAHLAPSSAPPSSPQENAATLAPVEKATKEEDISGSFAAFVQALRQENTWLRQREHRKAFAHIGDVLPPLRKRPDERVKQEKATELLDMAWSLYGPAEALPVTHKVGKKGMGVFEGGAYTHIFDPEVMDVDDLCFVDLEPVVEGLDDLLKGMMM